MVVTPELLAEFKNSIGHFSGASTEEDQRYTTLLKSAIAEYSAYDISEDQLRSDLGKTAIFLHAQLSNDGQDIATNPTINNLKATLSVRTKGDRVNV